MKKTVATANIARAWIAGAMAQAKHDNTDRLPTIKEIAASAGVSHKVVSTVVSAMAREGVLEVNRSTGIQLKKDADAGGGAPARTGSNVVWQRLQRQIHKDVLNGAFGFHHALPLQKELTAKYGVTFKTLQKALSSLVDEGVLVLSKRSYRPSLPTLSTGRDTLVLFVRGTPAGRLQYVHSRAMNDFVSFEKECLAHGVRMKYVSCFPGNDGFVFDAPTKRRCLEQGVIGANVLGYAVWQVSLEALFLTPLIEWLGGEKKPIALYNDSGEPLTPFSPGTRQQVRVFNADRDVEAGRKMGRFLLSLGHRRICVFIDRGDLGWAQDRLTGMREVFFSAGIADAVQECIAFIDPDTLKNIRRPWESEIRLAADLDSLVKKRGGSAFPQDVGAPLALGIYWAAYQEQINTVLHPKMRNLIGDRSVTAWVGINDSMAVTCQRFLQENGVPVPDRVSVAGFDDDTESAYRSITSFNFNGASAQHAIVDHLLRPGSGRDKGQPADVAVEGFIHERASTGQAKA